MDKAVNDTLGSGKSLAKVSGGIGDAPTENLFTLDQDDLKARGYFSTERKTGRLSLELRAIKRRLLRRVGFTRRREDTDAPVKNIILVTSTRPAEGKTFTAVNIALSLAAEDGIGAVLIDADAPRPRVLDQLGLDKDRKGLTNLIEGEEGLSLRDCMLEEAGGNLSVLPVGNSETNQSELYSLPETKAMIERISQLYPERIIIIDTPPVLATSDACLLAPLADEIVFVIEANGTTEPAVATALDELLDINDRVSLVLNRCLIQNEAAHYYSYDEYYARKGRAGERGNA